MNSTHINIKLYPDEDERYNNKKNDLFSRVVRFMSSSTVISFSSLVATFCWFTYSKSKYYLLEYPLTSLFTVACNTISVQFGAMIVSRLIGPFCRPLVPIMLLLSAGYFGTNKMNK